jgi:hypothetical protein
MCVRVRVCARVVVLALARRGVDLHHPEAPAGLRSERHCAALRGATRRVRFSARGKRARGGFGALRTSISTLQPTTLLCLPQRALLLICAAACPLPVRVLQQCENVTEQPGVGRLTMVSMCFGSTWEGDALPTRIACSEETCLSSFYDNGCKEFERILVDGKHR